MPVFIASLKRKVIGFLAINRHTKVSAEIHVMGVLPEDHRKGAGTALIKAAEDKLKYEGIQILEVKTIGESHPDKNYAKTRKFYSAQGFLPLKEIYDFWGKGLHTLFMVKSLLLDYQVFFNDLILLNILTERKRRLYLWHNFL